MFAQRRIPHLITLFCISILLLFVFSSFNLSLGQESEIWMKTFGGTNNDDCFSALIAPDGGYMLAGDTSSFGAGETDVWLVKTDITGNMEWNRTYGGALNDDAQFMVRINDGYLIAARTYSFGEGDADLWLIKTDFDGNMIWNRTYGGPGTDWIWSIVKSSDGGYSMVGRTNSFGAGNNDFWLIKTNSEGLLEWNKTIGYEGDERARFLVNTEDDGLLLLGWTNSMGEGEVDYWLVKTDYNGNPQWNKTYGGEMGDRGIVIKKTKDSGYILGGSSSSFGAGNSDIWLVRIDGQGNEIWNKTYGGLEGESIRSLLETNDGGYVIAGYTYSFGAGDQDGWFLEIDPTGTVLWNQTYGGIGRELIHSLQKNEQGGYLLAGFTSSTIEADTDIMLIKSDALGVIPEFPSVQSLLVVAMILTLIMVICKSKLRN